jgi:hypothetical protein
MDLRVSVQLICSVMTFLGTRQQWGKGWEKVMAWLLIPVVSLTIGMMLKDVIVSADKLSKYSFRE